jgi:hypothetical protein
LHGCFLLAAYAVAAKHLRCAADIHSLE